MAGRKYRLYDTVNNGWLEFNTQEEMNNLYNSEENISIHTPYSGYNFENSQNKRYVPSTPVETVGWAGEKDTRTPYNLVSLPEYKVGTPERKTFLETPIDVNEDESAWVSQYYTYLDKGFKGLPEDAQESYLSRYRDIDISRSSRNAMYDPKAFPFKGRVLTTIAGNNALQKYCDENDLSEDSPIRQLSKYGNVDFAKLAESNEQVNNLFNEVIDYYMRQYYGNILKKYENDPRSVSEDIVKNPYSIYNTQKQALQEDIESGKVSATGAAIRGLGIGVFDNALTKLSDFMSLKDKMPFTNTDYVNPQRKRAEAVLDIVSDRVSSRAVSSLEAMKNSDNQEQKQQYSNIVDEVLTGVRKDENGNIAKGASFDDIAKSLYPYYGKEGHIGGHIVGEEDLSDNDKVKLYYEYVSEIGTLGEKIANDNLARKLTTMDKDMQSWYEHIGVDGYKYATTLVGTGAQIFTGAAMWNPIALIGDVLGATKESIIDEDNFFKNLWGNAQDRFKRTLNNDVVQWANGLQNTGYWNLDNQKQAEKEGTELFHLVKDYGHEEDFSLDDAVPVLGMSRSIGWGAKGMAYVSKGLRSLSTMSKAIPVVSAMNAATTESAVARTLYTGISNMTRTARVTGAVLEGAAKTIDLAYPAYATAFLDFGYGYDRYSQDNLEALQFTGDGNFENANPEFKKMVTSDAAIKRALISLGNNEEEVNIITKENLDYIRENRPDIIELAYETESKVYREEVEKIALNDAMLTTALTMLPDLGINATWRKALFSPSSNATYNELRGRLRNKFGKKPNISPEISNVTYKDGKFNVEPNKFTWFDLAKPRWDSFKGGFASNYQQDLWVGFGTGYKESAIKQYLEQRFSDEVPDSINYCLSDILANSALEFGNAVGAYSSFRDGAYGAMGGIFSIYPMKRKSVSGTKGVLGKTDALLSNLGIPVYDLTFGAKSLINAENQSRAKAATTVQDWLDNNGEAYLNSIGGLIQLSKKERAAIMNNDWDAIEDSHRGKIASAAMMMALIGDKSGMVTTQVSAMRERAERGKVTKEDLKRLDPIIQQIKEATEVGNVEEVSSILESVTNDKDRSILLDLVEIDKYNKDAETIDTRSGVRKLNDLNEAAKKFINAYDNMYKYLSEAETMLPEADYTVQQEYARMMVYRDIIKEDVENAENTLNSINAKVDSSTESTIPVNSTAVALATSKGKLSNVSKELSRAEDAYSSLKYEMSQLKSISRELDSNTKDLLNSLMTAKKIEALKLKARIAGLKSFIKEANENGITEDSDVIISAKDIDNLSNSDKLALLTSENLTDKQKDEVNAYLNAVNTSDIAVGKDYLDLLSTSVNGRERIALLDSSEELSPEAVKRLNQKVSELRRKRNERWYELRKQETINDLKNITDYSEFASRFENEIKWLKDDSDGEDSIRALQNALANTPLYKEYKANQKAAEKTISDIKKYVVKTTLTDAEKNELYNAIHYAAERIGISDNILENLTSQPLDFYEGLKEYLESVLSTEVGSAEDLQRRLIYYNNGITSIVEKNKAEEEARKADKTNVEVKKAEDKSETSSVEGIINTLVSYLKDSDLNTIKALGSTLVGNINQESFYTKQVLSVFRDIVNKAVGSDATSITALVKTINDELSLLEPKSGIENPMSSSEYGALSVLCNALMSKISTQSTKLVPYIPTIQSSNGQVATGEGNGTVSITKKLTKGSPYTFADFSKHPDNFLYQLLEDHKVSEFLTNTKFTRDTKLVFLVSDEWESKTQESMGENYVAERDLPIIGAVEVSNATSTTITIDGKNYQPIGIMQSSEREANTAIVRTHAINNTKGKEGVRIVTDTTGEILSTNVENNPKAEIDNDAAPSKFELTGKTVTANKIQVSTDDKGNKHIRVNVTPASNDVIDTSKANWAYAEVAEMAETTNNEGQTLVEVENPVEFNSRTRGFNAVLNNVIKNLNTSGTNIRTYLKELSSVAVVKNGNYEKPTLNNKTNPSKDENKVGLSEFLSLANGYHWAMLMDSSKGTINLTIIDEATNNPIRSNGELLSFEITNKSAMESGSLDSVTPVGEIIRTLAQLRTKDGKETLVKWQVSYGNFDLSKTNAQGKQVDTSFKVPYIQQTVADGILYTLPSIIKHNVLISPVQDSYAKKAIEADNLRRQEEATAAETAKHIDPATGTVLTGTTIEEALETAKKDKTSLIKAGKFKEVVTAEKIYKFLSNLLSNKNRTESTRINRREVLKPNQTQTSTSVTGTTSIIKNGIKTATTNSDICNFVIGNCVDSAIRDFFNPSVETSKESFKEKYKDVLNDVTCERLYEAIEALNDAFAARGWRIISNGVYTIDEALDGGKVVGEVDLLALDAMGNIHIVDIKTFSDTFQDHNYSKQLSLYRDDLVRNTETTISPNDIHIFALKIDKNASYYNVTTDQNSGISTIEKKGKWTSKIQIEKGARFQLFDSTSTGVQIKYIGENEVQKLVEKRRRNVEDYISEPIKEETKEEPIVVEDKNEVIELEVDEGLDFAETDPSYYETSMSTEEQRNTECK